MNPPYYFLVNNKDNSIFSCNQLALVNMEAPFLQGSFVSKKKKVVKSTFFTPSTLVKDTTTKHISHNINVMDHHGSDSNNNTILLSALLLLLLQRGHRHVIMPSNQQ